MQHTIDSSLSPNPSARLPLSPIAVAVRLSLVCLGLSAGASHAATINVTSNLDDGGAMLCTLREAIVSFNDQPATLPDGCSNTGAAFGTNDTITFASNLPSNTITLNGTYLALGSFSNPIVDLTIDASNINDGITLNAGGASQVMSFSYANVSIDNLHITGGSVASGGGGLRAQTSTITLNNSSVSGNTASTTSGGIFTTNSMLTLYNSSVTNNSAGTNYGGIRVGGTLTLNDSDVSYNTAGAFLGGIHLVNAGSVTLNNSTVTHNVGDGVSANNNTVNSSSIVLNNSTVEHNNGSGLSGQNSTSLTVNNSDILNNMATDGGGIQGFRTVTLVNSTVSGNSASNQGGGLMGVVYSTLTNTVVSNNSASIGGGIDSFGGGGDPNTTTLINSSISNNAASGRGGGINVSNSGSINLIGSTINGNSSGANGGGVYANNDSEVSLTNSTVSGNSATVDGGAISVKMAFVGLSNATVSDNFATGNGGGFNLYQSSLYLSNSIIANNLAVAGTLDSDCYVAAASLFTVDAATIIEDNSCNAVRSGDPDLLPLADNGGFTLTHALAVSSVARDSADTNCPAEDQRGVTRNLSDGFCDVGAYEYTDEGTFFIIPLGSGKSAVIPL